MDETSKWRINLELRLSAVEFVLAEIGKMILLDAGISPDGARQMREAARETLLNDPFPGADSAMADHAGAEFADRVDALLGRIESLVAASYLKARR